MSNMQYDGRWVPLRVEFRYPSNYDGQAPSADEMKTPAWQDSVRQARDMLKAYRAFNVGISIPREADNTFQRFTATLLEIYAGDRELAGRDSGGNINDPSEVAGAIANLLYQNYKRGSATQVSITSINSLYPPTVDKEFVPDFKLTKGNVDTLIKALMKAGKYGSSLKGFEGGKTEDVSGIGAKEAVLAQNFSSAVLEKFREYLQSIDRSARSAQVQATPPAVQLAAYQPPTSVGVPDARKPAGGKTNLQTV